MTLSIMKLYHCAECHCAECRDLFIGMLNVIMLSVVRLNVVRLNVVRLNVVRLNVVRLNVVRLNVVRQNVVMLNVVMLTVVASIILLSSVICWLTWICCDFSLLKPNPGSLLLSANQSPMEQRSLLIVETGNTKGGSITVPLTSCLTSLESAVWHLTIFVFICKTDYSKPVKQEVNSTVILPPLVFPGRRLQERYQNCLCYWSQFGTKMFVLMNKNVIF